MHAVKLFIWKIPTVEITVGTKTDLSWSWHFERFFMEMLVSEWGTHLKDKRMSTQLTWVKYESYLSESHSTCFVKK